MKKNNGAKVLMSLPVLSWLALAGCVSPLIQASRNGDMHQAEAALNQNTDAYTMDAALREAAMNGHADIAELLLKHGASANALDPLGSTPLICAACNGHADVVRILLDHGADPSLKQSAQAQPEAAAQAGLLMAVAAPAASGRPGQSALECAQGRGYTQIVKMLKTAQKKQAQEDLAAPPAVETRPAAPVPPVIHSDADEPGYTTPENQDNYAMVVGIAKYHGLPDAAYADHDAEAVRTHLIAMGFAPRHIKLLTNEEATRSMLAAYLQDWLPKNVKPSSTVFFYYSGHGAPNTDNQQAYLVPSDGNPDYLDTTAYPLSELYKRLNALPAKQVIVALDSCFSGAGGRSVLAKGMRPLVTEIKMDVLTGDHMVTLTASKSTQTSGTLEEQGHGLFTYYMLKGLNGAAARNGQVTLQSLSDYLKPKVEDAASLNNHDQEPQLIPATAPALILR